VKVPTQQEQTRPCQVAAEHLAAFPTALALARWTRGGDIPHAFSSMHDAPLRAAWYAQAQRQFQAWLEVGGFHRQENLVAK
jgi:hypothetical protein